MRLCRVIFVSPPETNNNSNCLITPAKCIFYTGKNNLSSKTQTIDPMLNIIIKSSNVNDVNIISAHNFKLFCRFCKLEFKYDGAVNSNNYIQTTELSNVLTILGIQFQRIQEYHTSDTCSFCLVFVDYFYYSFIPVIINNYISSCMLFLITRMICVILPLLLPKTITNYKNFTASYLERSEKVRVENPLSK